MNLFGCNLTDHTNAESGTGERLTPYKLVRDSELFADFSYLVLEKVFERLNYRLKFYIIRDSYLIVMRLYFCRITLAAFDSIGIYCTLCEESAAVAFTDFASEHFIEFSSDNFSFLFGVNNAL